MYFWKQALISVLEIAFPKTLKYYYKEEKL